MNSKTAILLALAVVTSVAIPAAAASGDASTDGFDVAIDQHETGSATVTVTANGTAVENATVTVDSDESYAGNGTYATGANGTVSLPAPADAVTVTVTAIHENRSASQVVTLRPPEGDDLSIGVETGAGYVVVAVADDGRPVENATVTIEGNASLNATGTTDDAGIVAVGAPAATVTATITVTTADRTATRTVAIEGFDGRGPAHVPFGKTLEAYKDALRQDDLPEPLGHYVSGFASHGDDDERDRDEQAGEESEDHREKPEDADANRGPAERSERDERERRDVEEDEERKRDGRPEAAGREDTDRRDDEREEEHDDEDDGEEERENEDAEREGRERGQRGPPAHANGR